MYKYYIDSHWKELNVDCCEVIASSEEEAWKKFENGDYEIIYTDHIDTVYDEPKITGKEEIPPQHIKDCYDRTLEDIMKESETDSSDN